MFLAETQRRSQGYPGFANSHGKGGGMRGGGWAEWRWREWGDELQCFSGTELMKRGDVILGPGLA